MKNTAPSDKTLFASYVTLLALLSLTAFASGVTPPGFSGIVSLGIAALKACVILLIFMKLYYCSSRLRVVALGSLLWLGILFAITFSDYLTRGLIHVPGK
jgi:cytochrome c oxidase subunit 4